MTYPQRKDILDTHQHDKTFWQVTVGLQILVILYLIYSLIRLFSNHSIEYLFPKDGISLLFSSIAIFVIIGMLVFNILIVWGVYRLERWVKIWMWIAVVASALLFDIFHLALSLAVVLLYKKVLKIVYPPTPLVE